MDRKVKVYIGFDHREEIAWQVCKHSILRHSRQDVAIYPLNIRMLRELGLYTRPPDTKASTEFSLTRFLSPYLAAHEGWTIFADCDFLFTTDIHNVVDNLDKNAAVSVVKHDYTPVNAIKMDGKTQAVYPRKNWSSFMVFDHSHEAVNRLLPKVVNYESPAYLHRFSWLDDDMIGDLPLSWNFLVGEYPRPEVPPNAIHFTNGGPWFAELPDGDYANLWRAERALYLESTTPHRNTA